MIFHFLSDSGLSSATTTTTTTTASTVADEELNEVGDEDEAYYVNPAYQPDEDEGTTMSPERKFAVIRVTPASTDSNQGESAKPVYTFEL